MRGRVSTTSGDSAIFPWMQAGSKGRVDLAYYQSNNGDNSNDASNTGIWNVYFRQSLNALSEIQVPTATFTAFCFTDH